MKIIMLAGQENTGKSTTFNLLYDAIVSEIGEKGIIKPKETLGNPKNKDFECLIRYKEKNIALFSMGDYDDICFKAIVKYSNCDTLVLAYSTKFPVKLDNLVKESVEVSGIKNCVIEKTVTADKTNQEEYNNADCNRIIEEISLKNA